MSLRQIGTVALLALASFASAAKGVEKPAEQAVLGTDTVVGCFSDLGDMVEDSTDNYNSQGYCAPNCRDKGKLVGATYLKQCFCGTKLPNSKTLLKDAKCNEPCPGYDPEACGGLGAYTVYNTGVQVHVAEADAPESSTTSASSSTSTSTTSASEATTTAAQATPTPDSSKSKTNTAGIAAGVVVGVVIVGALAIGAFFYVRRKRNAQLEEEHRRNAAVNAFISGGKPPRSSGGMSIADSRMDPVMNRRMSDGSIADNQDYSRRILRVTNA